MKRKVKPALHAGFEAGLAHLVEAVKRRKAIYLEAARRIAEGEEDYACNAIMDAAGSTPLALRIEERDHFTAIFHPDPAEARDMMNLGWLRLLAESHDDARHRRVVALCFAAAMCS